MKRKERASKVGLKSFQKLSSHSNWKLYHHGVRGANERNSARFIFGFQNHCRQTTAMKIKRCCSLKKSCYSTGHIKNRDTFAKQQLSIKPCERQDAWDGVLVWRMLLIIDAFNWMLVTPWQLQKFHETQLSCPSQEIVLILIGSDWGCVWTPIFWPPNGKRTWNLFWKHLKLLGKIGRAEEKRDVRWRDGWAGTSVLHGTMSWSTSSRVGDWQQKPDLLQSMDQPESDMTEWTELNYQEFSQILSLTNTSFQNSQSSFFSLWLKEPKVWFENITWR